MRVEQHELQVYKNCENLSRDKLFNKLTKTLMH